MNKIEKLKFRKQLYNGISKSITDCLNDLDNKHRLEMFLSFLKGYFDAGYEKILEEEQNTFINIKLDLLGVSNND